MNSRSTSEIKKEFLRLANKFEAIAVGVEEALVHFKSTEQSESGIYVNDLSRQRPLADLIDSYQRSLAEAGRLCFMIYDEGPLDRVQGVVELATALRMTKLSWPCNEKNFFGLLVGGPSIELEDVRGAKTILNKPWAGWPMIVQVELRPPIDALRIDNVFIPAIEQCEMFASFCRWLARLLDEFQPNSEKDAHEKIEGPNPPPDGPIPPDLFVYDGRVCKFKAGKPFRMINELWHSNHKRAEISDLALPVWGDAELEIADGMIGRARTDANKFFEKHGLPHRVRKSGDYLIMENPTKKSG